MFRSDLKLTICYLSCFLQERKLVFSQGGFCPENSLFPRIDVCGTKVKLQLQLHRLSEAIPNISIVLGFPKSCARARFFVYSPPLGWHMYFAMCRSWSPHDTWRLYMCHAGTSSDTWQNTCAALGGAIHKKIVHERTILGKPKFIQNSGRFAQTRVHFFGTCTSCSTQNHESRVWDRSDSTQNGGNTEYDRKQRVMKQPKRSTVRCMRAHTKNTKWIDCNLFVPYHLKYQIRLKLVNIFNSNTSLLLLSESRGIAFRSENCWKYNANEIQLTVMWQIWPVKSKDCKG